MSFCSYEEAWGSPYEPSMNDMNTNVKQHDSHAVELALNNSNQNKDHGSSYGNSSEKNSEMHEVQGITETSNDNNGMVDEAPLRGSMLGGAIPANVWKTNEPPVTMRKQRDLGDIIADKIDSKFDAILNKLDKYINALNSKFLGSDNGETSWSDVFIFVAIGIATIILLDMFFKFGKWYMNNKTQNRISNMQSFMPHMNHSPMNGIVPNMSNYMNHPGHHSMNIPNMFSNSNIPPPNFKV